MIMLIGVWLEDMLALITTHLCFRDADTNELHGSEDEISLRPFSAIGNRIRGSTSKMFQNIAPLQGRTPA